MEILNWLNPTFIQKVLRKSEQDDSIEVSDINVKPGTSKGDNYLGDLLRVNVDFLRSKKHEKIAETTSLIVKVAPRGDFREDLVRSGKLYDTEISMLSNTLPRMENTHVGVGTISLAPRYIYSQIEVPIHLIMEDLKLKGLRIADRHAGLDLEHCLVAIRKLAVFHASSIALRDKDPQALMRYERGLCHESQPASLVAFVNGCAEALGKQVVKWPELNPRIREKLVKLSSVFYEKGSESTRFEQDDFNVLNHGDFWVNNMMFRYDERKKPVDAIFVDFQLSKHGSPAIDLLYFFGTSPSDDVRIHHRDLLLREYYASLTATMADLKCSTEAPGFDKLQEALRKRAFYEVIASFVILPLVLVEVEVQKGLDEIIKPDGTHENPGFESKIFRKVMTRVLPLFDSMGLLDV
ncbi:uncharacterized protein LOC124185053 [Neodiprion fabricii]|uniref:uncharacterized protein LOC124185053 n=1 Tax=Neodiprion fabricii TaxID=2872261 RepID=UPI001ED91D0C|nr:uncharacterized protein LOC124185053 [Neodiprion fabricii]XP_046431340.1 uncharacterized protein LOC124185053 [Neodiprion fabricii]